jgi:hypothetical protein
MENNSIVKNKWQIGRKHLQYQKQTKGTDFFPPVLEIEPRALHILGNNSTTELHP